MDEKNNVKKKILIVEDEKHIAQTLAFNLMQEGYEYDIAFDGEAGLKKAYSGEFDLILLDLMLPKMDGFEVCRRVRAKLSTPIIVVTAREDDIDKIFMFDIGADDYVTKPFKIKVLMSRVKANIRRASNELVINESDEANPNVITIRDLVIDNDKYQVKKNDESILLTKKEYELLVHMARNLGTIYTREALLESVWGYEGFYGDIRTVDVTVSRLREKLETDPAKPEYIHTKRQVGYFIS